MATRRLNFTNRKRIRREDARISIVQAGAGFRMKANLRLGDYELPDDARVYVEAYRRMQHMRFDYGSPEKPGAVSETLLSVFDSPAGIRFRVKVVSGGSPRGLILAEADGLSPRGEDDAEEILDDLLTVRADATLDDEFWRVEFDDEQFVLNLNPQFGDPGRICGSPEFRTFVLPAILREILVRIVLVDEHHDAEDEFDPRSRWLSFLAMIPGAPSLDALSGDGGSDELYEWIDQAVAAFCRRHQLRRQFPAATLEGGES